jgi:hypothetical protein
VVERRKSDQKTLELNHTDNGQFFINLASLSSLSLHRKISDVTLNQLEPIQWINSIHTGLIKRGTTVVKKQVKTLKKTTNCFDIEIGSRTELNYVKTKLDVTKGGKESPFDLLFLQQLF